MTYNPTAKRYQRDQGVPVPIVRFGPSEFPRLDTTPAPYLPLRLHNERHSEYYVVLTGKVIALDSYGFVVPAGLALQVEAAKAAGEDAAWPASCERYDATDVAQGVINARGVAAQSGEPVVHSLMTSAAYDDEDDAVPAVLNEITIGNHIGVAPYSFLRAGSDVLSRSANANVMHPAAASGKDATKPYDPTQLRHLAWELQNRVTALVSEEVLLLPVVANLNGNLIEGQCVAIGAMASFPLGGYVTYDANSNFIPQALNIAAADGDNPTEAEIEAALNKHLDRRVGQVVRKNTRFPSSYLDKVRTRWESSVPGFNALDRMPGSATDGYPWHMHTAGSTLGEIQVSLLMR